VSQLFADGFEGGNYTAWTGTTTSGTATLAVASAAALAGSQGSRSTYSTAGDNNWEAKATRTFTPPVTARLFAVAAVRLTSVVGVGYSAVGSKAVMAIRASDGQEQAWFSIRSGGLRFSYRARNGTINSINSLITLNVNTIAYLRILVDRAGSNPIVQGWISGNGIDWMDVGSVTDASSGTQGIAKPSGQLDVGIVHITNFEPGNYTVDVDAAQILDSLSVTDWQVQSNLVQPVAFVHATSIDRRTVAAKSLTLPASLQGARNVSVVSEQAFVPRMALSTLREALTTSSQAIGVDLSTDVEIDHQSDVDSDFALVSQMLGNKDWQQDVSTDFGFHAAQHARSGEIPQPVTVLLSDRAWGEVSVVDSEA